MSDTDLCNQALYEIGEAPIASLGEATKRARACNSVYPQKRKALLMRYRWTFAMARATLIPDTATPEFGFAFQFQLPSDCLMVVGLGDDRESVRNYTSSYEIYKVEGRKLLYRYNTVQIFYVRDVTDTSLFDPLFAEALVYSIAHRLAYALSTGTGRIGDLTRDYREAVRVAKMQNAIQVTPEQIESDEYLGSRFSDLEGDFLRIGPVVT